jgi:hypothetical protein
MAETIDNMVGRALDMAGRPSNSHAGEGERMVQNAYQKAMSVLRFAYRNQTVTVPSGNTTGDYSLKNDLGLTDLVAIKYINVANAASGLSNYTMILVDPAVILDMRTAIGAQTTTPRYAIEGIDMISFYPNFAAGDTITFHYYYRPADVIGEDLLDPALFPPEFSEYIVYQAAAWLAPAGKQHRAGIVTAKFYQDMASGLLQDLKRWRNLTQGSRAKTAVPAYRLSYAGRSPGQYPNSN